jgi:hypothetical protein
MIFLKIKKTKQKSKPITLEAIWQSVPALPAHQAPSSVLLQ